MFTFRYTFPAESILSRTENAHAPAGILASPARIKSRLHVPHYMAARAFLLIAYPFVLSMECFMQEVICKLKVLNRVVLLVPIYMVNNLERKWEKFSSNMLFHNMSVFSDKLAVNCNKFVSSIIDGPRPHRSFDSYKRITMSVPQHVVDIAHTTGISFPCARFYIASFHTHHRIKTILRAQVIFPIYT